jgi:hypothetical protein
MSTNKQHTLWRNGERTCDRDVCQRQLYPVQNYCGITCATKDLGREIAVSHTCGS